MKFMVQLNIIIDSTAKTKFLYEMTASRHILDDLEIVNLLFSVGSLLSKKVLILNQHLFLEKIHHRFLRILK